MIQANDKGRAVLLLGHGSKLAEANETLKKVAASIESRGGFRCVYPAYLQMAKPDFQEAVAALVERGYRDITVMPYFLYSGAHVTSDIPDEIEKARLRHNGLNFTVAGSLGFHERLVDIAIERIEGPPAGNGQMGAEAQHPIEKESFDIIGRELGDAGFSAAELPIVKRVIHTSADFEYKDTLRFSPGAIGAGVEAIRKGGNIITDVRMVESGITRARSSGFGNTVMCFSSDEDVAVASQKAGITKTAASMRKAARFMEGGIVAIGNAPTALAELLRLIKSGEARPALVVGIPVGFVGAVETKKELLDSGAACITNVGRKGGSTIAAAIVNALFILAAEKAGAGRTGI